MARSMSMEPDAPVFRAVIYKRYREGAPLIVSYEGPYATAGAAKARVTFWANWIGVRLAGAEDMREGAFGHIEQGEVSWCPVK